MMSNVSNLSRMNSMKIRSLINVLSGLDKTDLSWTILSRLHEKFRNLTLLLNGENNQMALSRLDEVFRILNLILNVINHQTASSGLDEVFRISTFVLNNKDDEPGSTRLTCLALVIIPFGHR